MTSLANNESAMDLLASPEVQHSMNESGISEEELLVLRDHFGESPLVDSLEPCAMFSLFFFRILRRERALGGVRGHAGAQGHRLEEKRDLLHLFQHVQVSQQETPELSNQHFMTMRNISFDYADLYSPGTGSSSWG